jgi:site-specific DNA-methyltransferase (adenine-specific)
MLKLEEISLNWPGKSSSTTIPTGRLQKVSSGDARFSVVQGDNAIALNCLADRHPEQASLVYLDPPFFTGRQHLRILRSRDESGEILRESEPAFDDRWQSLSGYLEHLQARVIAARRLLCANGSLVLHVDPKTSHYARVLLDEIFGPECFVSEIVWRYRRWPSKTPNYQRVHDVLLRYVRDAAVTPKFNQLYEPLAASTLATWGTNKQRAKFDGKGRRRCSSTTEEASPGVPLGDVWDIGIVAPVARERTGYPTQKPEALLARLVESLTMPGDWVVDPYVGSGTTLAVCARLGRRATGIDSNPAAIELTKQRLVQLDARASHEQVIAGPAVRRAARASSSASKRVA